MSSFKATRVTLLFLPVRGRPDTAPANGGKLPTPRSALEVNLHSNLGTHPHTTLLRLSSRWQAMSMVGLARQQGVFSFWTQKPPVSINAINLHWASSTGASFYYPANE